MLEHVVVGFDGVVVGHFDAVFAEQLAVWQVWIGGDAGIWKRSLGVIKIHDVQVEGSELSRVDCEVAEEACSLEHGCDVCTAYPAASINRLNSSVDPSVLLWHGHDIQKAHVILSAQFCHLADVVVLDTHSDVESFGPQIGSNQRIDVLHDFEHDREELSGDERSPVIVGSVDNAEQEVVVAIGESNGI